MNIKLKDEASWELCMKCGNKEEINASNSKYVSPHEWTFSHIAMLVSQKWMNIISPSTEYIHMFFQLLKKTEAMTLIINSASNGFSDAVGFNVGTLGKLRRWASYWTTTFSPTSWWLCALGDGNDGSGSSHRKKLWFYGEHFGIVWLKKWRTTCIILPKPPGFCTSKLNPYVFLFLTNMVVYVSKWSTDPGKFW